MQYHACHPEPKQRQAAVDDEERQPYKRIVQLVDRAEEQGGFITRNLNVVVEDVELNHVDTIRFRELMMARQNEREQDKTADYRAAQGQGYRAAINDMLLALRDLPGARG